MQIAPRRPEPWIALSHCMLGMAGPRDPLRALRFAERALALSKVCPGILSLLFSSRYVCALNPTFKTTTSTNLLLLFFTFYRVLSMTLVHMCACMFVKPSF
jgi:hypothetical protein